MRTIPVTISPHSMKEIGRLTMEEDSLRFCREQMGKGNIIQMFGEISLTNNQLTSVSFLAFQPTKQVEDYTNEELLNIVLTRMKETS